MPQLFTSLTDTLLIDALQRGAVGIAPTDTVYGVVAAAGQEATVRRLYALKAREHKPGTLVAASIEQMVGLGIKARYLKAVEQFWPAAVSVIVPTPPELAYLDQGKRSLAVRIPGDAAFRSFLTHTGPLITSSANQPGEPPATTIGEARAYFGEQPDFYVDGGDLSGRASSTVIRIIDDAIEIVRQGAVKIKENER